MTSTLLVAALWFGQDAKPAPAAPTLEIVGESGGAMAPVARAMKEHFADAYPKLVQRFGSAERPAPTKVTLKFDPNLKIPGLCKGNEVSVSTAWLEKHPEDIGMLTHELTHAVQNYPPGAPGWLVEGIADYSRKVFGPKRQPEWALPERLTVRNSYKESYRVAARFLEWLEQRNPGIVDKLHRRLQTGKHQRQDFEEFAGKPLDALWDECVARLSKPPAKS